MMQSKTTLFLSLALAFIYFSHCQGDACHINGLNPEDLKNLSYDPPEKELLSNEQDRKAWQYFIENYENPMRKVQNWYNSISNKKSADAAADAFTTDVLPILKKLTGRTADIKKQVLAIPTSSEMQKLILSRILTLQSRLLVMVLPMQDSRKANSDACYYGSTKLFDTFLGATSTTAIDIAKFIETQNETQENIEAAFKSPWTTLP